MKLTVALGLVALTSSVSGLPGNIHDPVKGYEHFNARRQAPSTATEPTIQVKNGTLVGRTDGLVDDFVGIPYAQPPVGQLRLRPPQSLNSSFGTLRLPQIATACPQQPLSAVNTSILSTEAAQLLDAAGSPYTDPQGEDCLTLTVQRPAGTKSDARLPVLLWIYGGGFQTGTTSQYNGSLIVQQSVASGKPVVFVAMNYRLSAFGFLASRELQKDGSTNLGLKDQRLAMEYVSENIEMFGGDPDKITIWGESAGAFSVFDHLLVSNGYNKYQGRNLFTRAIMSSGTIMPALPVDSPGAERVYGYVVQAAGCSQAYNTLECLRSVPYETFFNASNSAPNDLSYTALALPYLPRPDPLDHFFHWDMEEAIKHGKFAHVPVIMGDQEDEGTGFAVPQRNLSSTQDVVDYFAPRFPLAFKRDVARLVETYPDDVTAGSPFGTGSANVLYPQFKRVAAIGGDLVFTLRRRQALVSMASKIPSWSYLSTYFAGFPYLGTFHGSDDAEIFTGTPNATLGVGILDYYFNFVYSGAPDGPGLKPWPQWKLSDRVLLNISMQDVTYLQDDFRGSSFEVLTNDTALFAL